MMVAQTQPSPHRPVIGITVQHGSREWLQKNTQNYLNTLQNLGLAPVILAPDTPVTLPNGEEVAPDQSGRLHAAVLDHLDGLILSGGGDVDPVYFGAQLDGAEPHRIHPMRDELEINLTRTALALDLPVFGICRGSQVLNVAAGGGMLQHFDGHRSPKNATKFHNVDVVLQTRLHQIVGIPSLPVNTFHHQGMDQASLAPSFCATAFAHPDSWLVEAFESPEHRWVFGVQWHPERLFELEAPHRYLWDSFVAACSDVHAANMP